MTGNLTISNATPAIILNKTASGQPAIIVGGLGGVGRWQIQLGDNIAEGGGDIGSNFSIGRFNNAGTFIDSPMTINRATGTMTIIAGAGNPGVLVKSEA
jgi:hypothetical protein